MKPTRLLAEVWRNLSSRPSLSAVAVLVALFIGLASASWAIVDSARIQGQWEAQLLHGAFTVRVVEVRGEPLSGQRCDDLNAVVGVQASGALIDEQLATTYGRPGTRIYVQRVTPGYIAVAFPAEPDVLGIGVLAGSDVSTNVGLSNGDVLAVVDRDSPTPYRILIERAAATTSRVSGVGGAILVASVPDSEVSECLVDIHPNYFDSVLLTLQGWFDGKNVMAAPILPGDNTRADPESDLNERPTRYVGIGAGVALVAFAVAMWLIRRGDLALYRLLGMQHRHLLAMAAADTLVLLAAPFCVGVTTAVVAYRSQFVPATLATLPWDLGQALPILALAPWLCVLLVWIARPLLTLREA